MRRCSTGDLLGQCRASGGAAGDERPCHGRRVTRSEPSGRGLCVLVGVTHDDDAGRASRMAAKLWHLRILADDAGVMNRSAGETGGEVLVVSQFTLYGDTSQGRRPEWVAAARPEQAEPLVDAVVGRATGARGHGGHRPASAPTCGSPSSTTGRSP